MENQQHHKMRDKFEGQQQPPLTSTASPPSASSSPSHEFSFTISLHPSATTTAAAAVHDKAKAPPSIAIDLSPADEIFFHGHLLPLHLLSHLPVSPRCSTHSLDNLTIPKLLDNNQNPTKNATRNNTEHINSNKENHRQSNQDDFHDIKVRPKSKSFSLFGLSSKWKKGYEVRGKGEKERHKRRLSFDMSHVLKRYIKMVKPLFRGRRENMQFHREPHSFSGNLSLRGKQESKGMKGQNSAPASMRTSPTNSGLLVATGALPTSTSDSTMEELQSAIQAAIAHCKNSIAAGEKTKCQD